MEIIKLDSKNSEILKIEIKKKKTDKAWQVIILREGDLNPQWNFFPSFRRVRWFGHDFC